uniref:Leucine-rich repeat-containing protein 40 n=1 Tax=Plectus sambesii TaxID=2011161 RepID=A0A914UW58_9BILA
MGLKSHNQLGQLPASIGKLDDLRLLKIDNNQLSDLPESLNNCAFLEELDASQNRLECLPKNLFDGCRRIRSLKLNCNKLTGLAPDIGWLQNLTSLDVSDNQLGPSLAKEIGELTRLEQLYAGSNRIAVIQGLERCSELKELNLACNLIEEVDDDFFRNMTQLMAIDLRENKLKAIPQSVLKLNALERLNLERNDISNVPPTLSLLPHLKTLIMSNNPIKTIRRDILQRGSSELLKYLKTRIAPEDETEQKKSEDNLFDGINARISDGIRTKRLDLSCRALTDLSTDIVEKLKGKEIHLIDLSQNQFSAFPSSVTAMSDSLRDLSLNKNQLTALSDDVSRLRCLTTLKLSANRLGTLPDSLAECANLFELDISNNCFTSIPDVVYKLVKLESLFASDNKIALIDMDRLLPMVQLANLGLANNEITQVPPQLGLMKLKSLQLEGNGFKVPRAQTLAKGTAEVLLYLRGRIPGYVEE